MNLLLSSRLCECSLIALCVVFVWFLGVCAPKMCVCTCRAHFFHEKRVNCRVCHARAVQIRAQASHPNECTHVFVGSPVPSAMVQRRNGTSVCWIVYVRAGVHVLKAYARRMSRLKRWQRVRNPVCFTSINCTGVNLAF